MNNLNILVVDDVIDNIQMAIKILQNDTYHFHYALNGQNALDVIAAEPTKFDVILLDVMMPGLDGFETCQRIVNAPDYDDIPVIFLTAKTDIDSITKGFSVGGSDYISKPYHPDELKVRVKNYLTQRVAKKMLRQRNIDLNNQLKLTKEHAQKIQDSYQEQVIIYGKMLDLADTYQDIPKELASLMSELNKKHPNLGSALD